MRILLTGANGQVGFELRRALAPLGIVVPFDRRGLDLADADAIVGTIRSLQPDLLVNAAAYTAVDRAEVDSSMAYAVNATALEVIGSQAATLGFPVVHYSSDYVFDGSGTDARTEDAATGPLGVYGNSKLAGERVLFASGADAIVFRTSWVFGAYGNNFLKTILRLAGERDELSVVDDQIGAPTSAALIADVTAQVLGRLRLERHSLAGQSLFHLAAAGETSWHGLARLIVSRARAAVPGLRLDPQAIRPVTTAAYGAPAPRPANSRLDSTKLTSTFGLVTPEWESGVAHVLEQLLERG